MKIPELGELSGEERLQKTWSCLSQVSIFTVELLLPFGAWAHWQHRPSVHDDELLREMRSNTNRDCVHLNAVDELLRERKDELQTCYDACAAYCLSHYLQQHFLGLSSDVALPEGLNVKGVEGCRWALKVIEIELAFLYDIFFTGNAFLHYYQAKTTSLWALASFTAMT